MTEHTTPASPCISQCKLDDSGHYCTGCLRTLAEISGWSSASDEQKHAALERIAGLRQARPPRSLQCERCGQHFSCGSGGKQGGCWCADLPPVLSARAPSNDCLCPACLSAITGKP